MQHLDSDLTRRRFGRTACVLIVGAGAALVATLAKSPLPGRAAGIWPPAPNPPAPHADPGGINMVGGGVWRPRSVEQSAVAADKIVLATVTKVGPSFWSTPDGQRPAGATDSHALNSAIIYTSITAQVTRGLKRAVPGDVLTFVQPGGKVGPDLYTVWTEPTYQVAEQLLLLLAPPAPLYGGKRTGTLVQDVFRVTPQGRAVALHYEANLDLQNVLARIAVAVGS